MNKFKSTFSNNSTDPKNVQSKTPKHLLMKNLKLTLVLPALAVFASCSQDPVEEVVDQNLVEPGTEVTAQDAMVETANPNTPQGVQDVYFAGQRIPVESFNGEYVYQGDIMIPKDMASTQEVKVVYEKGEMPTQEKYRKNFWKMAKQHSLLRD